MKLAFVLLISFQLFFTSLVEAQRFEGGLQGGLNLCQVDGDRNGGYNKLGYNLGTFLHYVLKDEHHSIGFDIMYMHKGSRTSTDRNNLGAPLIIYYYNYVELPFYYRYTMNHLTFRGGLNWAYMINNKMDDGGRQREMDEIRKTDFLFHFGAEYQFSEKLAIMGLYQYSIRSIVPRNTSQIHSVSFPGLRRNGVYHNLIQVSLKYYFTRND